MLSRKCFDKCIGALLIFNQVEVSDKMNDMLYRLMSNDFTDKEFSTVCGDICKTENLFGKYPMPKMFYDRKAKMDATELVEEGCFFIDNTIPEYKEALIGMTDDEITNVWKWIYKNKRGEHVSKAFVVERIKQFNTHNKAPELEHFTLSNVKALLFNRKK